MLDWNGSVNGHLHRRSGNWNVRQTVLAESIYTRVCVCECAGGGGGGGGAGEMLP